MSPLKTVLIVAVASSALTAGVLFQWHHLRAREAGRLRSQNSQLRMQVMQRRAELQASRATAVAPAHEREDVAPAAPSTAIAPVPAPKPAAVYHNKGTATPQATLQTFAWACDRADTETVGDLIYMDPVARTKIEAHLASLPESVRSKWKSVDEMAATLLTHQGMARPFPDGDILATATLEEVSAARVVLHLPGTYRSRTEYVKTDSGWKYAITEPMVDDYIKRSSQPQ